jgi:hypothetical protein
MQRSRFLAHLRDAAQERRSFFADERFAESFTPGAEHPCRDSHQAKQRHGDEEFPLHALSLKIVPMARPVFAISQPALRITALSPRVSPLPLASAIVLILLMISRLSLPMIVPESVLPPEPPVEGLLFC